MRADKLVAYYRVSTARQEASGLGLDAQRQAVAAFLGGSAVVAEFTETESGKRTDRPELARAIGACRLYGARLVIAKRACRKLCRRPWERRDPPRFHTSLTF